MATTFSLPGSRMDSFPVAGALHCLGRSQEHRPHLLVRHLHLLRRARPTIHRGELPANRRPFRQGDCHRQFRHERPQGPLPAAGPIRGAPRPGAASGSQRARLLLPERPHDARPAAPSCSPTSTPPGAGSLCPRRSAWASTASWPVSITRPTSPPAGGWRKSSSRSSTRTSNSRPSSLR
jgi:hypothetical protein